MGPLTAIGRCYRKIVTFSGRARRAEYWWFAAYLFVMALVTQGALIAYLLRDPTALIALSSPVMAEIWFKENLASLNRLWILVSIGWLLLGALPQWTVTVRRLHDTNRSGWFILMPALVAVICVVAIFALSLMGDLGPMSLPLMIGAAALPILAQLWFLVVLCLRGTEGDNRFGPDPLQERTNRAPAHPAFAQRLHPLEQSELQAMRRAEIKEYYRKNVLKEGPRETPA
jgi:uncharacterized membrane protein YhaH (DUF805 family)